MDITLAEKIKHEMLGNGLTDHNGCSWLCSYQGTQGRAKIGVSPEEKKLLQNLARQVAALAELPVQEQRRKRWTAHRSLKITRPLVFIDPEYAWYELIPHTVLQCKNDLARLWEYRLRKEIYWQENICDDRVCTKDFPVCHVYSMTGMGLEAKRTHSGQAAGAYHIDPVLTDWDDMGKLKFRKIIVDYDKTNRILELAHDVFDGILNVSIQNSWWYSDGLSDEVVNLRGMENLMYDFYDYPDELHALMGFLRDERMHMLDFLEKENLLTLNNAGEFIGTGGYGWCDELPGADYDPDAVKCSNLCGYGESQTTVSVSPKLFDEFILDYQAPILSRFGMNFYGCCEVMDKRLKYVREKIPRLRTVSVAPWCDLENMAQQMRGDFVYCWKQNPALIAVKEPDWEQIRKEIRNAFEITAQYGCPTEVLMRDVRSLAFQPDNPARWAKIAAEEAGRIFGTE